MAGLHVLNKEMSKVMAAILARIPKGETAVKIADNDAFMPLCVERDVWDSFDVLQAMRKMDGIEDCFTVSLCHYGEQNGDAMRDPEVVFLCYKRGGEWKYAPATYQNDYMGIYERDVFMRDGNIFFKAGSQRDLKDFCNTWMKNLLYQQNIFSVA